MAEVTQTRFSVFGLKPRKRWLWTSVYNAPRYFLSGCTDVELKCRRVPSFSEVLWYDLWRPRVFHETLTSDDLHVVMPMRMVLGHGVTFNFEGCVKTLSYVEDPRSIRMSIVTRCLSVPVGIYQESGPKFEFDLNKCPHCGAMSFNRRK